LEKEWNSWLIVAGMVLAIFQRARSLSVGSEMRVQNSGESGFP